MLSDKRYDVSALVLSYNPNYEKLIMTIKSLLLQDGVRIQIVVADDGSKEDYFDELVLYFADINFTDYYLVKNQENQGTVKNLLSGLKKCEGNYVKPISPGDYMFGESALQDWAKYMEDNDVDVCGSKYACYYYNSEGKMIASRQRLHPQLTGLKGQKLRINYFIKDDIYLGAATLCKRELLVKYVSMLENKVKYGEDNCYRIMAYCGEKMGFYNKEALLYELGPGVSTSNSNKWKLLLRKDEDATFNIMLNTETFDRKIKEMFKSYLNMKKSRGGVLRCLRCFKIRGLVLFKLRVKIMPKYSVDALPCDWVKQIGGGCS